MQQRFLLQILLLAQHVSGTTMPIIRSSIVLCSILQTGHTTLSSTPDQQLENHNTKYHRQQPLHNTFELLMIGIVVPETCWSSNKICNKKPVLHLVAILFPHMYEYTGSHRRNGPNFGRVFLMLKYTDITQNTYIQSWTVTEIMAREFWKFDSCYTLTDCQIHIETGRNMWFL